MMNQIMMTSSNRNIFCVTGPLCGKFTDDRWIPLTKAGALMFSLICAWINGWLNNRQAGDLKRHRAHYDVTVMINVYALTWSWLQGKRWKLSRNCYFGWICQFLLYHQHQNTHYGDVIMSAMASQIICVSIVTGEFPAQRASKADIFFHLMTSSCCQLIWKLIYNRCENGMVLLYETYAITLNDTIGAESI